MFVFVTPEDRIHYSVHDSLSRLTGFKNKKKNYKSELLMILCFISYFAIDMNVWFDFGVP